MQGKINQKNISDEASSLLFTSVIKQIINKNPKDYCDKIKEYGINLGTRLSDDYFMRGNLREKVEFIEISRILSTIFFPTYFKHRPNFNSNIIFMAEYLEKLPINDKFSCLIFFSGVLEKICNYLSNEEISIVIHSHPAYSIEFQNTDDIKNSNHDTIRKYQCDNVNTEKKN